MLKYLIGTIVYKLSRGVKDLTDTEFDFRVELILKNDKNGLREIYQCYGKVIYNIMLDIVKSPQDAEDLTSDFFLKLWDTAGQYRKGTGHKRYLTVMAKNLALDFIRKRRHETPTLDDDEAGHKEQQDSMRVDDDVIGKLTFEEALKLLSEGERDILNMRLGMDMTFREISRAVGKPLGTVTWKYRQAVFKLKKTIKEDSIYG